MPLDRLANRVAADLDALMREAHIPGVGLSVVCDGTVLLAEGYGQADPEACIPATRDTLYPLASLAKGFTATAVMQLVEQGEIVLDAALSTYLSGLPLAWRSVTPRHLLTHTSGIPCYLNDMPDASSYPDTFPEEDRTTVTVFSNIGNVAGALADLAKRVVFLHLPGA